MKKTERKEEEKVGYTHGYRMTMGKYAEHNAMKKKKIGRCEKG